MAGLNRRQFLVAGALGTAGAALETGARQLQSPEKPWNARTERGLRKYGDPIPTVCSGCSAACALLAFRDGDRVVQIGPNPASPQFATLCPRSYEALESLYDPERVLRPLRRKGERGQGRWEEISWGEALGAVAKALAESPGEAYVDMGRPDPLAGAILGALGVPNLIEEESSRTWASRHAQKAIHGAPLGRPDLSRARMILLLGARPLDDGPDSGPTARDLAAAKARGAAIVAISSYAGVTGSLATEWIPCRPGTEALVALALTRVALSEGWLERTDFRKLVGVSTENLLAALSPYKLEFVEAAAGVPVPSLVRLTRRLATEKPAFCLVDGSGTRQAEALEAAAAVLNCLAGNPEAAGIRTARRPDFIPTLEPSVPRTKAVKDILNGNARASLYLAYRSNPAYRIAQSDSVRRVLADPDRIGLLVAMDTQLTETAAMADLVLPAAADLELWNLMGGFTPEGRPYALLQQPTPRRPAEPVLLREPGLAVEKLFEGPKTGRLGEARQLGDALLEILAILQHPARQRFPYPDSGAYVRTIVDGLPVPGSETGFQRLVREGIWVGPGTASPWGGAKDLPAGPRKLNVSEMMLVRNVPAELNRQEGDAFALVILRYPELSPGYSNTRWGREIRYENPVYMNTAAARKMGLRKGDRVVIRTAVGEATVPVVPIEGIHPQALAWAEDFGHWAGGVAATARARATGDEPRSLLVKRGNPLEAPLRMVEQHTMPGQIPWWAEHGPGISVWALSPFMSDELGAQAWKEISVTIRPA